jgi:hypothetical protein
LFTLLVKGASTERVARGAKTGAMNLRAVALCAWVASLAHLLILFNRFDAVSPGAAALVATGLLSAIPALWVASAVLLAPGDVRAAVSVLTGRTGSLPVAVPATPESVAMKFARHRADDGEWSDLDEATAMSGGAHRHHRQTRGDGSEKATPVALNRFGRPLSPASPSSPLQTHADISASGAPGRHEGHNARSFGSNRSRLSLSSRDSKDVTASMSADSADERDSRLADRLSGEDARLRGADESDDSEDDGESWRDAVVGIKGMAQALHDANNHVSMVALNADLTVSLSTMMLNTLRLFEASGARGPRGDQKSSHHPNAFGAFEKGGANAESEPVDVAHLENVHKIVADTCALAEPLFDKDTPLVLYNTLPPDEMCFLARDTFACCLFALVYRAGTRVVRGSCRLTTERAAAPRGDEKEEKIHGNGPSRGAVSLAGSPLAPRAGVRIAMEYLAAATDGAHERVSLDLERSSSGSERTQKDVSRRGVRDEAKRLGAAEMQFWRRRLRRLGGSLSVRRVSGPGVGIATEQIVMWVPTAGSDTFGDGEGESGARASRVAALRSIVERGERFAEERAAEESASSDARHPKRNNSDRCVSLDVVSLTPNTPGPATTTAATATATDENRSAERVVSADPARAKEAASVSFEATDDASDDDQFDFTHPDAREDRRRRRSATLSPSPRTSERRTDDASAGAVSSARSIHDSLTRDARPSAGSSFHDSLYDSYLSTASADFSILYVEDERVQAYFFVNKCKRVFGDRCRVVHETDGVAALERLNRGEQFAVVVSDIFMAGMDGISFFHTLFDANLNAGAASQRPGPQPGGDFAKKEGGQTYPQKYPAPPPRLNIVLTGADVDPSRGAEDAELALDLNDLQDTYGVLCYNKTSAVDVVVDVIKPHVAFVERALKARLSDAGRGMDGESGIESDDERSDWIPAPAPTRGTVPETDPNAPSDALGSIDPSDERLDGSTDALVGSGAAANLVARSGASYGAFGRPFPDVSGLRDE